jgi:tRNA A37 threonylcarbamoyladenosine biosynthesis protein TsaE
MILRLVRKLIFIFEQLTSPTYNIVNTHMCIQLLTTVTPTNI